MVTGYILSHGSVASRIVLCHFTATAASSGLHNFLKSIQFNLNRDFGKYQKI